MNPRAPAPPESYSPKDLERLRQILYARTGMRFGESKRYYIERRLRDRIETTKAPSASAYLASVPADPHEVEALINCFTVNETYFYREAHQLRCLSSALLPEIVRHRGPGDKVRIWSAACATGEEAYSIALWLLENWRMVDAYNVEIVGSDIDSRALAAARQGLYADRAVARLPPQVLAEYFEAAPRRHHQIINDLRESVTFTSANLIDRASTTPNGRFDVIFCRNVLIYFDDASRRAAALTLYDNLTPGGFLCLGHSESMSRMPDLFDQRRFDDAIVYQRPGGPE